MHARNSDALHMGMILAACYSMEGLLNPTQKSPLCLDLCYSSIHTALYITGVSVSSFVNTKINNSNASLNYPVGT